MTDSNSAEDTLESQTALVHSILAQEGQKGKGLAELFADNRKSEQTL